MPRDLNGNYSLPAGNPVVPTTIIETDWANPTMDDVASALTNSLSRTGSGGMLVPFRNASGDNLSPGITWTDEPTSGFYRDSVGVFGYAITTVPIFTIAAGGITMAVGKRVSVPDGSTGQQAVNFNQVSAAIQAIEPFFSMRQEQQVATAGQTVFPLTTISYALGVNNLSVYQNGLRLFIGDFSETSSTVVTLATPAAVGDVLLFISSESLSLTTPVNITGGTINNTVIGGTTPAAGSFTTLNATGLAVTGALSATGASSGDTGRFANGVWVDSTAALSWGTYPSFTDYIVGNTTLHTVSIQVDSAIRGVFSASGLAVTGQLSTSVNLTVTGGTITTGSTTALSLATSGGNQVQVTNAASAVNYWTLTGSAAGFTPSIIVAGTDTNIPVLFRSKGVAGVILGSTLGNALRVFAVPGGNRTLDVTNSNGGNLTLGTSAGNLAITSAVVLPASTTAVASLNVPHGAAPTTPVNGDMWTTTAGLFVRINGVTVGPLA